MRLRARYGVENSLFLRILSFNRDGEQPARGRTPGGEVTRLALGALGPDPSQRPHEVVVAAAVDIVVVVVVARLPPLRAEPSRGATAEPTGGHKNARARF